RGEAQGREQGKADTGGRVTVRGHWLPPERRIGRRIGEHCRRRNARARSPSKESLLKRRSMPQNRCYRTHRKGGAVTERARREYAAALRERYQVADKRGRGQILDEYCRTTRCHRKTAIRRLAGSVGPTGRRPGRPRRYGPDLLPLLE